MMGTEHDRLVAAVNRRRLLQVLGAGAGAVALAPSLSGVTRALAQSGGELIVGAPQDRQGLPAPLTNIGMAIPSAGIYDTLVRLSPSFVLEPGLAESWELIEPTTWRFNLRQGVTFHDGTPFTAEAVAWSLARVAAAGGRELFIGDDSVVIVDDYTVEITPFQENRRLPLQLTAPRTGSILAPGTDNAVERVGTGPFREVEYVPEERQVGEAFADHWGGPPLLSRLTFRFMPDPTTRLLALQAGEVDLIFDVPREAASQLTGNLQLITSGVGAYDALYFNIHGEPPYDLGQDPAIRAAVAHAIDEEALIAAWQGLAEPNTTMVPPAVLGDAAEMVEGTPYDPAAATRLLEEAGWTPGDDGILQKDGRRLTLTMVVGYPSAEIHRPMPEFVQAQLRDVGIELQIVQTPDVGDYSDALTRGEGDLWAEVGNQVDADPCYLPASLFSSPPSDGDPEVNQYSNAFAPGPEFDAFITECNQATTLEEIQEAAAKALNLLIDEQHVVLPLVGVIRLYGASERVVGFEPHPSQFNQRRDTVDVTAG